MSGWRHPHTMRPVHPLAAHLPTTRYHLIRPPPPPLTTSNSEGMPLANSTDANTAAPRDSVPVSCSVTLLTKLRQYSTAQDSTA